MSEIVDRSKYLRSRLEEIDRDPSLTLGTLPSVDPEDKNIPVNIDSADNILFLARAKLLNDNLMETIELIKVSARIYDQLRDDDGLFYSYHNCAIASREMFESNDAIYYANLAHDVGYKLDNVEYMLISLTSIVTLYSHQGMFEEARKLHEQSLPLIERTDDLKIKADFLNNYGFSMLKMGDVQEATNSIKQALANYQEYAPDQVIPNQVISTYNYGLCLVEAGDDDAALEQFHLARKNADYLGFRMMNMDSMFHISKIHERRNEWKTAYEYQLKYIDLYKKIFGKTGKNLKKDNTEDLKKQLAESKDLAMIRNVELKKKAIDLREMISNVKLISRIGQELTSTYDMDEIFYTLKDSIRMWVQASSISLGLVDWEKREITVDYLSDYEDMVEGMSTVIKLDNPISMMAYCVRENTDIKIDDFHTDYKQYVPELQVFDDGEFTPATKSHKKDMNRSGMYCRLVDQGNIIGVILAQDRAPNRYKDSHFEAIKAVSNFMAIAVSNSLKNKTIQQKAHELEVLSYSDTLTQLQNRRAFTMKIEALNEKKADFAMIMADMNHLKRVNDNYGHMLGDQYLVEIARILDRVFEGYSTFRLSGDEFAVILENISREDLFKLIQRTKDECKKKDMGKYPLAVAMGCAFSLGKRSLETLFTYAEARMYVDKVDYYKENGIIMGRSTDPK